MLADHNDQKTLSQHDLRRRLLRHVLTRNHSNYQNHYLDSPFWRPSEVFIFCSSPKSFAAGGTIPTSEKGLSILHYTIKR